MRKNKHAPAALTPIGLAFLIEHPAVFGCTLRTLADTEVRDVTNATSVELARYRAILDAAGLSTVPTPGWIERINDSITRRQGLLDHLYQELRARELHAQARGRRENGYVREASNT